MIAERAFLFQHLCFHPKFKNSNIPNPTQKSKNLKGNSPVICSGHYLFLDPGIGTSHCSNQIQTIQTIMSCIRFQQRLLGWKSENLLEVWGHSQTTLTRFCPLLTTYPPTHCWHLWRNSSTEIRKNLHTVDISSTTSTYLPHLVNVVRGCPFFIPQCLAFVSLFFKDGYLIWLS